MEQLDWRALDQLRNGRSNLEAARLALGPRASRAKVKSLANYFSRIIRGRVPHVSVSALHQLAIGFGYPTLGLFFIAFDLARVPRPRRHRQGYPSRATVAQFLVPQAAQLYSVIAQSDGSGGRLPARKRSRAKPQTSATTGSSDDEDIVQASDRLVALAEEKLHAFQDLVVQFEEAVAANQEIRAAVAARTTARSFPPLAERPARPPRAHAKA